jgi:capsular polysaccharide biosynthesis protein
MDEKKEGLKNGDKQAFQFQQFPQYYEDEIDLAELFGILKKRKNIVFGTAAFFFVLALAYILLVMVLKMELYEIYAYASLGIKDIVSYTNTNTNTWTLGDIRGIIKSNDWIEKNIKGKYPHKVYEEMKVLDIKVENDRKSSLLKIYMYYPNKRDGKKLMKIFLKEIQAYTDKYFSKGAKKRALQVLAIKKKELDEMKKLADRLDENMYLLSSKERVKSISEEDRVGVSAIYSSLAVYYLSLKNRIRETNLFILNLQSKIKDLGLFSYLSDVYSSKEPVKPKKKLILAVALVSGLFLGVFLAFFYEWYEKNKEKMKA